MKLSPKYQVVIPECVREALALKPGMEPEVIAKLDRKTIREKKDRG